MIAHFLIWLFTQRKVSLISIRSTSSNSNVIHVMSTIKLKSKAHSKEKFLIKLTSMEQSPVWRALDVQHSCRKRVTYCYWLAVVITFKRKFSKWPSWHLSLEEDRHRLPCRPIVPFLLNDYLKNPQWHYPMVLTRYPKDYEKGRHHGEFQHQPPTIVLEVCLLIPVQ